MREAYLSGSVTPADDEPTPTELNLTKIKLDNGGVYVEYTTGEADGQAEVTARHKRPPHLDLLTAFNRLVPHLCLLCDLVQGVQVGDEFVPAGQVFGLPPEEGGVELHERLEFAAFKVTGLTYSTTGAVLVGQKRYRRGKKVLNLVTPHEALEPDVLTGDEYEHLWELRGALNQLEAEARLYLNGKTGAHVEQGELDFEGPKPGGAEADAVAVGASNRTVKVAREVGKFVDFTDDLGKNKGYTVTVGRPGEVQFELGKGRPKRDKDAAAGPPARTTASPHEQG